jgi:hypothetical protein
MTDDDLLRVNPNVADLETLEQLPGVGKALAERILAESPFTDLEDMLRVPGLGKATLARLAPHIDFEEMVEAVEADTIPTEQVVEEEIEPLEEVSSEKEEKTTPIRVRPRVRTRRPLLDLSQPLWMVLGTTALSVILSVLLTLAILGGINRTLNIEKHRTVVRIENTLVELESELMDFSFRLQAVEGLSGRVESVEDEFSTLREDLLQSLESMKMVQVLVDDLSGEVETLSEQYGRFDAFLEGLRTLIQEPSETP